MSASYTRVMVMGHLTRDPELRKLPSGNAVVQLGVAANESYRNAKGETVDKPCFVDVVVFGEQADTCAKYLKKGRAVLVDGKLQFDEWETKEGEKRTKLRVRGQSVQFLGGDGNGGFKGRRPDGKGGSAPVRTAAADVAEESPPF